MHSMNVDPEEYSQSPCAVFTPSPALDRSLYEGVGFANLTIEVFRVPIGPYRKKQFCNRFRTDYLEPSATHRATQTLNATMNPETLNPEP